MSVPAYACSVVHQLNIISQYDHVAILGSISHVAYIPQTDSIGKLATASEVDPIPLDLCQSRSEGILHCPGTTGWLAQVHSRRDDFLDVGHVRQGLLDPRGQSNGRDTGIAVMKHM